MSYELNRVRGTIRRLSDGVVFDEDDRDATYRNEYLPWLRAGGTPQEAPEAKVIVPEKIDRGGLLLALSDAGLLTEARAVIAAAPARLRLALEELSVFRRNDDPSNPVNRLLVALPSNAGKRGWELRAQRDALFIAGAAAAG